MFNKHREKQEAGFALIFLAAAKEDWEQRGVSSDPETEALVQLRDNLVEFEALGACLVVCEQREERLQKRLVMEDAAIRLRNQHFVHSQLVYYPLLLLDSGLARPNAQSLEDLMIEGEVEQGAERGFGAQFFHQQVCQRVQIGAHGEDAALDRLASSVADAPRASVLKHGLDLSPVLLEGFQFNIHRRGFLGLNAER